MRNRPRRSRWAAIPLFMVFATAAAAPTQAAPGDTGRYTYSGPGTVNTHWIETPGGGLVVIDVQRDLTHAREALAAVRATGKPVRAVLITHGHPDHYAGVGLFKDAFPEAVVWASEVTDRTIRTDSYGYNAFMRQAAPGNFPDALTPPDRTFADDVTLEIDGLQILVKEMGRAEANSATVYYVPATRDLYVGDLILYRMHALLSEGATGAWLAALDRLEREFPEAATVHPGHGDPGPARTLLSSQRDYIQAARRAVADELMRGRPAAAVRARARSAILKSYFDYGFPAGLPDIVGVSVDGLITELRPTANEGAQR